MVCKVRGCRFSSTHLTLYHKCGNCNKYGHGRYECLYENNKRALLTNFLCSSQTIPIELHCQIETCTLPWTHHRIAHHCSLCGGNGHDMTTECGHIVNKKCPICTMYSDINIKNTIYTDTDCAICMDNSNKKVVFEACGHAQVCNDCVVQL